MDFRVVYRVLKDLCCTCHWKIDWYELDSSKRVLTKLDPTLVCALPLQGSHVNTHDFWPPPQRGPKPGQRQTAKAKPGARGAAGRSKAKAVATATLPLPNEPAPDTDEEVDNLPAVEADMDDHDNDDNDNLALLLRSDALQEFYVDMEAQACEQPANKVDDTLGAAMHNVAAIEMENVVPNSVAAPMDTPTAVVVDDAETRIEHTPRAIGLRGSTGVADAVAFITGGKISYYAGRNSFEASCMNASHSQCLRCTISRTSRGRMRQGQETNIGGRPCGFLACWLADHTVATRQQHLNKDVMRGYDLERRTAARAALMTTAAGRDLCQYERALLPGEADEPVTLAGLLK
eukprot:3537993-Amphidinium_carterae.2